MAKQTKAQKAAAARKAARTRAANKKNKRNNKSSNRFGSAFSKQWSKLSSVAGTTAAFAQITGPDMAASTGQPIAIRAKNFINSLVGRTTGYSPFAKTPGAGGNIPQTVSIDGMFNKYTGIGAGMLIYSMIPSRLLPHKGKAKQLGKALFGGGIIGGAFSEQSPNGNNNLINNHSVSYSPNAQGVTI